MQVSYLHEAEHGAGQNVERGRYSMDATISLFTSFVPRMCSYRCIESSTCTSCTYIEVIPRPGPVGVGYPHRFRDTRGIVRGQTRVAMPSELCTNKAVHSSAVCKDCDTARSSVRWCE